MKIKPKTLGTGLLCLIGAAAFAPLGRAQENPAAPATDVKTALARSGKNRPRLERALREVPAGQRAGMAFLIANMPERDLQTLAADFLLSNVALAYQARAEVAWGKKIPEDVFLNNVLAYANVDESRDPWRKEMYDLCLPLVKDCKTPGEAAQLLNRTVFPRLKVRYSTKRKKPHQSPKESIETGTASCTGLSILLVDACRSVCVPARLVGTPLWANKSGNHTWVEVWDEGWHFTGACEADPNGLDRGWFTGNAAQAQKDSPEHAIYAASFRKTPLAFPLVWAPGQKNVYAENVTDRYARAAAKDNRVRVAIRVWQAGRTARLAVPVTVSEGSAGKAVGEGLSRGESADANDMLTFELIPGKAYTLRLGKPVRREHEIQTGAGKEQLVEIELPAEGEAQPAAKPGLTPKQEQKIDKEARAYYAATGEEQAKWPASPELDALLARDEPAVRQAVWKAYQAAPIHAARKTDFEADQVRSKEHRSPYKLHTVGKRPKNGWPLVIAMHGGGGVPKAVNDSQWQMMERYYRDQPAAGGYKYVALRAPNDVWNGFYDNYVPPLVINLIRAFILFGDVDFDKVFLIGYSHGGYGAFFIGPKVPDRFAAVHCSAAAPTDGTISAVNLRNTQFTFMIGEKDTAFGRRERCEKFAKEVEALKNDNPGEYPVAMELKKGFGHGGLPDRDKLKEILGFTRNAWPRHLTWEPTDTLIKDFFWLSTAAPAKGQRLDALVKDNHIEVKTQAVKQFDIALDPRLVAFDRPLRITLNGVALVRAVRPDFRVLCQSMQERGDPRLAYTCRIRIEVNSK